jgi:hypothetical protein
MRIKIKDDNQNWFNWGKLVNTWIDDPAKWPKTVGELKQQLQQNSVEAWVDGSDARRVVVDMYAAPPDEQAANPDSIPLQLKLPNAKMRDKRFQEDVKAGPYPLPLFYNSFFAGAKRAPLSAQEAHDFAFRRIGEYTVNECC